MLLVPATSLLGVGFTTAPKWIHHYVITTFTTTTTTTALRIPPTISTLSTPSYSILLLLLLFLLLLLLLLDVTLAYHFCSILLPSNISVIAQITTPIPIPPPPSPPSKSYLRVQLISIIILSCFSRDSYTLLQDYSSLARSAKHPSPVESTIV